LRRPEQDRTEPRRDRRPQSRLDQYLANPKQFMPGTKMVYAGMKDPAQRQAVIAYLRDAK
jgi:cytochrome c